MPAMFIERDDVIREDEWRRAVTTCGGRFVGDTLDVELPDDDGIFRHVLRWTGGSAEFSMMSYVRPFAARIDAIARELGGKVIDNDGALYFHA